MTKYVKLSAPVYLDCDHVRVESLFDRDAGGYVIECVPVGYKLGMVSMVYGPEYFAIQGKTAVLAVPAGRRSVRKQDEADRLLSTMVLMCAGEFLERIGRTDLEVRGCA